MRIHSGKQQNSIMTLNEQQYGVHTLPVIVNRTFRSQTQSNSSCESNKSKHGTSGKFNFQTNVTQSSSQMQSSFCDSSFLMAEISMSTCDLF